jgi:23S rRNA G2445 N2-methylase RlmL
MEKEFKNIVVINYGHNHTEYFDVDLLQSSNELTSSKWFDYVVSDGVIDSLRNVLDSKNVDKSQLRKIVYDDIINDRNVVYCSSSQESAFKKASELSKNQLIMELT